MCQHSGFAPYRHSQPIALASRATAAGRTGAHCAEEAGRHMLRGTFTKFGRVSAVKAAALAQVRGIQYM